MPGHGSGSWNERKRSAPRGHGGFLSAVPEMSMPLGMICSMPGMWLKEETSVNPLETTSFAALDHFRPFAKSHCRLRLGSAQTERTSLVTFGNGSNAPVYLSINYASLEQARQPSKEDSEKVFRNMLGVLDGWLK
jgi:hypothetical protein